MFTFMTKKESKSLHLKQLERRLASDQLLKNPQRPNAGWLKATRQAMGLSLKAVAKRLNSSPQAIHQFEKSEAARTISVKNLELVADSMGCALVYVLIPRKGTFAELANSESDEGIRSVLHTMALEGQAVDGPDAAV
jgi:predicted DNA-binding mobile mystery protein A